MNYPLRLSLLAFLILFLAACGNVSQSPSLSTQSATVTVTNTNDSGPGSLRQAIAGVDAGGTITFDSSLSGQTITLTSGQLTINKDLTITGPSGSITISRDTSRDSDATVADNVKFFRVILVGASSGSAVTVTLENLTITNGRVDVGAGIYVWGNGTLNLNNSIVSNNTADNGGGINTNGGTVYINDSTVSDNTANGNGGGIRTEGKGTVYINNSTVSDNKANVTGGGIRTEGSGTVYINDSTVSNNTAESFGGGIRGFGNNVTVYINDSTVSHNTASGDGGGIASQDGTLEIVRSTIADNTSSSFGGGIVTLGVSLTLSHSTVSGNLAHEGGGGIASQHSTGTILNSTIAGNTATGAAEAAGEGGGIVLFIGTTFTISHSTIAGNTAVQSGGIKTHTDTHLTLHSSIVAGNLGTNTPNPQHDLGLSGTLTATYSLIGSTSGHSITGGTNGNIVGVDPKLALDSDNKPLLANNGGPTRTVALLAGSPAIDAGVCTDHTGTTVATDQRGVERPQRNGCDIGAFEKVYSFPGFLAPVNGNAVNVAKAGQAIPVKFNLGGDWGLNIFASGYPRSQPVHCDASVPQDPMTETVTAGGSSLSYDATTDTYTYVWKTDKSWANTCRTLTLQFTDGTTQTASFRFTR